jgi:hypothetical protein
MNDRDFIYYIIKQNGMCEIMEGNPRDPYIDHHQSVASVKAEKCKAFDIEGNNKFYFMDEEFNVSMF